MKRASTLRCSEKQVFLKRINAAINRQSITDFIKFRQSPLMENPLMGFIFSKWQLEVFSFIKFKNEVLGNYVFRILTRYLMALSKWEVSVTGVHCIPKIECSHLKCRQNIWNILARSMKLHWKWTSSSCIFNYFV